MNNAVCVNVEGDFNLWHSARCWRQIDQLELAQRCVVTSHVSFPLLNVATTNALQAAAGSASGGSGACAGASSSDAVAPGRVLIHCSQGVSRSASLAIAYMMWKRAAGYDEVFQEVKAARGVANPNIGFICQVGGWLGVEVGLLM